MIDVLVDRKSIVSPYFDETIDFYCGISYIDDKTVMLSFESVIDLFRFKIMHNYLHFM